MNKHKDFTVAILVTKDTFQQEVLLADLPVVVDFFATWCPPCQRLAPVFEKLSSQMLTHKFVKINIDDNHDLAVKYGISSIPTLILFKAGLPVKKEFPKSFDLEGLRKQIESWIE